MSVQAELRIKRRGTRAFIAAQPSTIALTPGTPAKTKTGGMTREVQPPRDPQVLRLIDQSSTGGNIPGRNRSDNGGETKAQHQLLGEHDAEMAVGDYWVDGGIRYEVSELMPFNGYERRAVVVQYGT